MVQAKKRHELLDELGSIVGAKYVSDDYSVLLSYTRDVSTFPTGKPQGVIARPGSVDEVVEIVRLANQTRVPIIPMGGKASISGVPPGQPGRGIIVDMRRMDKVLDIDDLVASDDTFFAITGITDGELVDGVKYFGAGATTHSLVTRSRTGTVREIRATHRWDQLMAVSEIQYDRIG